ncbi:MAG: glycerol-3-phosphate dehydrogenase/oxidase [Cyanophyceae cyanobacterium]
MHRNLTKLTEKVYDLLIIGGGIYGACMAREASLRGLSVALVEKGDFGSATSANSLKIIHGGLRYLQNADFKRMRESICERTTLMRIAPHLVHPLPILIPTYGHGLKGKKALGVAMMLNDLISSDRNWIQDRQKHIPRGRVISKRECLEYLPTIPTARLTGGATFTDAQVYNSERLTLAFVRAAEQAGADVANYVQVVGFIQEGDRIIGVRANDALAGTPLEIRAQTVVNTSGPWVNQVLGLLNRQQAQPWARAMNLVLRRPLFSTYAVGLANRNGRFLFVVPWRERSIIGTSYTPWQGEPDALSVSERDIRDFLNEVNQTFPAAQLSREDVALVHSGLLPCSRTIQGEPILTKHYQIYDHAQQGWPGLISVTGVKYTTARDVAQKAIDYIFHTWEQQPPPSISSLTPVYGGQIEQFAEFLQEAIARFAHTLEEKVVRRLVYNYGSAYPNVLKYLISHPPNDLAVLRAEVIYAIREEMAQRLSDVVFRRTELGSAGCLNPELLQFCAEVMGTELGWSPVRTQQELRTIDVASYSAVAP